MAVKELVPHPDDVQRLLSESFQQTQTLRKLYAISVRIHGPGHRQEPAADLRQPHNADRRAVAGA